MATKTNEVEGVTYNFTVPNENKDDARARVIFRSYAWEPPTPDTAKTTGPKQGADGMSATLYLPANFAEEYGAKWENADIVTALLDRNMNGVGTSTAEWLDNALKQPLGGIVNTGKYGAGMTSFPGQFLQFLQGNPITPSFTFQLLPMNKKEADNIVKMIRDFKKVILPLYSGMVLRYPKIWSIGFHGINGPGFPEMEGYQNMALTNVKVSYGGGEQSALVFKDKNPVMISLTLSFQSIMHSFLQ